MNIKDVCKSVCIIIMSITIVCISSLFIIPIRTYNVIIIISVIVSIMFIKIIWLIVIKSTLHQYTKRPSPSYDRMKMTAQCLRLAPEVIIFANNNIIIYINDIAHSSKLFHFVIYADDTTLCSTLDKNTNIKEMNIQLNNITDWLKINKLSLDVAKTKPILFHKPQKKITAKSTHK